MLYLYSSEYVICAPKDTEFLYRKVSPFSAISEDDDDDDEQ